MNTATTEKVDAIDAYDLATLAREHGKWLGSIARAIQLNCKHKNGTDALDLANLAQYLADDLSNHMDCEAERIKRVEGLQ
ncbi:hypothetical protein N5E86_09450 [Stutzerimonas stutzeri]|uniref:hypothetical protein n=1 Tax=Stutzerimonas stutzeri TaxID=316 RepID=UPI00244BDEC0|nr:hypothetical protein [Stutzerimonas stutzeri]MDH1554670.1 hypothetical protein [Stutzerimonas stutzeri]